MKILDFSKNSFLPFWKKTLKNVHKNSYKIMSLYFMNSNSLVTNQIDYTVLMYEFLKVKIKPRLFGR